MMDEQSLVVGAAFVVAAAAPMLAVCLMRARQAARVLGRVPSARRAWNSPVQVPGPPYPDTWSADLDQLDIVLAQREKQTWSDSTWQRLLRCPVAREVGYASERQALAAHPHADAYACRCGLIHVRAPRRWKQLLGGARG